MQISVYLLRVVSIRAAMSLRELRVAEVVELDMVIDDGKVTADRAKIKVSFKYESG